MKYLKIFENYKMIDSFYDMSGVIVYITDSIYDSPGVTRIEYITDNGKKSSYSGTPKEIKEDFIDTEKQFELDIDKPKYGYNEYVYGEDDDITDTEEPTKKSTHNPVPDTNPILYDIIYTNKYKKVEVLAYTIPETSVYSLMGKFKKEYKYSNGTISKKPQ